MVGLGMGKDRDEEGVLFIMKDFWFSLKISSKYNNIIPQ